MSEVYQKYFYSNHFRSTCQKGYIILKLDIVLWFFETTLFVLIKVHFPSKFKYVLFYLSSVTVLCLLIVIVLPIISGGFKKNKVTDAETTTQNEIIANQPDIKSQVKGAAKEQDAQAAFSNIYLGMWTQGFFDPQSFVLHPEALKYLETTIGKKVAIAHYYRGWEELAKSQVVDELNVISANGWRPMISTNPYFFDKCVPSGQDLYKTIASGNCDSFMHSVARNLKSFGKPLFLRFAWEMNIDSIEWGISRVGSTPAEFIAAWRRLHDIVKSDGATNISWVFSPNVKDGKSISYKALYPGDVYVDWLGLDGYNWGTTQTWSSWQSFNQVFVPSYSEITKIAPQKPLMIAEVNSTNIGGNKADWYSDMLEHQLPQNFPKVKAVVFYNEDRSSQENVNWLIDITTQSLSAFKTGIEKPFYLSSF